MYVRVCLRARVLDCVWEWLCVTDPSVADHRIYEECLGTAVDSAMILFTTGFPIWTAERSLHMKVLCGSSRAPCKQQVWKCQTLHTVTPTQLLSHHSHENCVHLWSLSSPGVWASSLYLLPPLIDMHASLCVIELWNESESKQVDFSVLPHVHPLKPFY